MTSHWPRRLMDTVQCLATLFWMMARQMFSFGVVLYLLGVTVYTVARLTVGESFVIVTLGNIFVHWLLALSVVLLPMALLFRLRWLSAGLSPVVLAFALMYGGLLIPKQQVALADSTHTLRVMTFNSAVYYTQPSELLDMIQANEPDVVSLVELSHINATMLAESLAESYPYQILNGGSVEGKGLLSRYPIVAHDLFTLYTDRPNIEATLDINGHEVVVYVVHPPSPDASASWNFYAPDPNNPAEIAALLARAPSDVPVLLLGDFNFTDQSPTYAAIHEAGYADSFREAGTGFGGTFYQHVVPIGAGRYIWLWRDPPIARIDYIWHSSHFHTVFATTGTESHSDHVPVIADLTLQ